MDKSGWGRNDGSSWVGEPVRGKYKQRNEDEDDHDDDDECIEHEASSLNHH